MARERDEARAQAAKAGVLESRLRQLESANASVPTGGTEKMTASGPIQLSYCPARHR